MWKCGIGHLMGIEQILKSCSSDEASLTRVFELQATKSGDIMKSPDKTLDKLNN